MPRSDARNRLVESLNVPHELQHGRPDGVYNTWHRLDSISRFIPPEIAEEMLSIDVDLLEINSGGYALMLTEAVRANTWPLRKIKNTSGISKLADVERKFNLPAYLVAYEPANRPNPADERYEDIERFFVQRRLPKPQHKKYFIELTPQQWAEKLVKIRRWSHDSWNAQRSRGRIAMPSIEELISFTDGC